MLANNKVCVIKKGSVYYSVLMCV
uniref:Uncharacterized protein n=1 Tax=Anguilla anguilla TaxID=7936 RepID=A0A0E9XPI1_ANGAN